MKNLLLLCLGLILLTSCEMTEKVYLEEDGAVKYALDIDLSQINMMKINENDEDSQLPIDTIFTVNDLQQSDLEYAKKIGEALEDQMIQEMFKNFNFHIKMNDVHSSITLFTKEQSTEKLNQAFVAMDQAHKDYMKKMKDSLSNENPDKNIPFQSNLRLYYTGNTFEREGYYENQVEQDESLNMGDMEGIMMSLMTYNLEYHFPKPITSITDSTAMMSFDRKTVYIRKSISELKANPEAYNFKVTFN